MTAFVLTPAAQADVEDIWTYSVDRWDEAQAVAYVEAIRDACQGLAAGTRIGRPSTSGPGTGRFRSARISFSSGAMKQAELSSCGSSTAAWMSDVTFDGAVGPICSWSILILQRRACAAGRTWGQLDIVIPGQHLYEPARALLTPLEAGALRVR